MNERRLTQRDVVLELFDDGRFDARPTECDVCGAPLANPGRGRKRCSAACRRAAQRELERASRARLKSDPAWLERKRELDRQRQRVRRAQLKSDPAWLERQREYGRSRRARLRNDPARRERERERWREWNRTSAGRTSAAVRVFLRRSPLGALAVVERFDPWEVFERDGWRCHVCDRSVDPNATLRRDRPSLDHIVPVEAGGLHSRANVRLAHQGCNAGRATRARHANARQDERREARA